MASRKVSQASLIVSSCETTQRQNSSLASPARKYEVNVSSRSGLVWWKRQKWVPQGISPTRSSPVAVEEAFSADLFNRRSDVIRHNNYLGLVRQTSTHRQESQFRIRY